jgi:predicted small metal-binding protein
MNGGRFMKTRLECPCGELIKAKDEDELVEKAFAHLNDKHPEFADAYEREHILFMAH